MTQGMCIVRKLDREYCLAMYIPSDNGESIMAL